MTELRESEKMSTPLRDDAWKAHREGDLSRAETLYRQLLEARPAADDALNLAALLRQQGRLNEASGLYKYYIPLFPDELHLLLNATNCFQDLKEHQHSAHLLQEYLKRFPQERRARWALARCWSDLGRHQAAEGELFQLTKEDPSDVSCWMELGLSQHRQEKFVDALGSFNKASELEPNNKNALANRLTILKDWGKYQEAQQLLDSLSPAIRDATEIRSAAATAFLSEGRVFEAINELVPLCERKPSDGGLWLNLGACLRELRFNNSARHVLRQGLVLSPDNLSLLHALGQCIAELGNPKVALTLLRRSNQDDEIQNLDHLFNLQFLGSAYHLIEPRELALMASKWEENRKNSAKIYPAWKDAIRNRPDQRKLRVSYLSADWANHPVCRFMLPILKTHDREKVEVFGISSSPKQDSLSELARSYCDQWLDIRHATDTEAARVMADLKLDVIVELGGYTGHSRLGSLIERPAPIQLSYLGYFAPTYLNSIDGWIGDKELFAGLSQREKEAHQLWHIKKGYMAYDTLGDPPIISDCATPSRKRFCFGSFNHSRKLTPETVRLYVDVLQKHTDSELRLKSIAFVEPEETQRVRHCFERFGIDSSRIKLLEPTKEARDHLEKYNEIDLVLDPVPYGGATTTCEALIMGVPIVTLAGAGMVGRLSSSILHSAGLKKMVAHDSKEYLQIAGKFFKRGVRTTQDRLNLRDSVLRSDLCNARRVSQELERIYKEACLAHDVT